MVVETRMELGRDRLNTRTKVVTEENNRWTIVLEAVDVVRGLPMKEAIR